MGLIITIIAIVASVAALATAAITLAAKEKKRQKDAELRRLKLEIKPHEYWMSLHQRENHVPTGAFSVKGIRQALNNDVIPASYSLDQLAMVGFHPETVAYTAREEVERNRLQTNLAQTIGELLSHIDKLIQEQKDNPADEDLRQEINHLRNVGVTSTYLNKARDIVKQATEGKLEIATASLFLQEVNGMLELGKASKSTLDAGREAQAAVNASELARGKVLQVIANRWFGRAKNLIT